MMAQHGSELKVLHAIQNLELGGGPASAVSLVNALAEDPKHEVHLLAGEGPIARRISDQVNFHSLPTSKFVVPQVRWIAHLVGQLKPDVVHVHGARFAVQVRIARWRAKWQCPIVVTQHSNGFRFVPDRFAGKLLNSVSAHVIALTELSRDRLVKDGIDTSKISVIPHPFQISELPDRVDEPGRSGDRERFGAKASEMVVLVASRLVERKGLHDFINAMSHVRAAKSDAIGLIAGAGPLSADLQKLVEDSAAPDAVRLLGYQADMKGLLGAADVVLFLSEEEVLPMFVVEAMANGVPVVARRIPAVESLIQHGVNGVLVNDVEQASGEVIRLLNDVTERTRISESALQVVKERFATPVVVEKTVSLYQSLV